MAEEVELTELDLRYESYRMKHPALEKRLLGSIAERGIEEPLEVVAVDGCLVVLNGFKRCRCAKKLGIGIVSYTSLGEDEVVGIINLLSTSNNKSLSILEQAGFVDELKNVHKLSVGEIAVELCRSKSWVSVRTGLIAEMSEKIRERLFSGTFPVYSYMTTVRQFMRINGVKLEEIEQFLEATSGKNLSVREIEQLAHGFFRGPESFRNEIRSGNLALPLAQIKEAAKSWDGCSDFEQALLRDLEITQKYMQRTMGKSQDPRLGSRAFYAQSNLLITGILSRAQAFFHSLRKLHDRTGQA